MKTSIRRGVLLALVLALVAAPLLVTAAGARPERGRERPRYGAPDRPGRGRGPARQERPGYREQRIDRRHHRGPGVMPFLGGLAIGAIIGGHSHNYCPPPPPPVVRRVYVYDCDWCPCQFRDYDAWVGHLMVTHGVPDYQIGDYFPPFARGHWEAY